MDLFNKLKEMRTLLIDDDKWIRGSMSLFFQGEGCHLTTLETAEEGLKLLESHHYDIIIADYFLPAYGNNQLMADAYNIGIHDFINKPFTTKTIEESLYRTILKHKFTARNHLLS